MKTVETFTAQIYVGLKVRDSGMLHDIDEARAICRTFVNAAKLCVSFMPCEFIYVNGAEPGCVIGLINYPRFPADRDQIAAWAIELAWQLKVALGQLKVSVVFPNETIMLGGDE